MRERKVRRFEERVSARCESVLTRGRNSAHPDRPSACLQWTQRNPTGRAPPASRAGVPPPATSNASRISFLIKLVEGRKLSFSV